MTTPTKAAELAEKLDAILNGPATTTTAEAAAIREAAALLRASEGRVQEGFPLAVTSAPAQTWTNERCEYEVCDEAETHDPKCKAWPLTAEPAARCKSCDDTGDVHDQTGEWRGICSCVAGDAIRAPAPGQARVNERTYQTVLGEVREILGVPTGHNVTDWAKAKIEEIEELRANVLAYRKQCDTLLHQVLCCGVAASHTDATLTTRGAYAGKWNSPQAEEVRKLRAERDAMLTAAPHPPAQQAEPLGYMNAGHVDEMRQGRCTHYAYVYTKKQPGASTPIWTSPPPHKAEGAEPTSDEVIELAQAFEQLRARKIAEAVYALPIGGVGSNMPTPFQAGYQSACEEILHRLDTEVWEHCLVPPGAKATTQEPSA